MDPKAWAHGTNYGMGKAHGNSSLGPDEVKQIRILKGTFSSREVSRMFLVGRTTIRDIWTRKTWKWLAEEEYGKTRSHSTPSR